MAVKTDPTPDTGGLANQATTKAARKPIVVLDEAGVDTKQAQASETKITMQTKVSKSATTSDEPNTEEPVSEEQQPLRKSGPIVINPISSTTPTDAKDKTEEVATTDETKTDETTENLGGETSPKNTDVDKMKQSDKNEQDYEKIEKRNKEIEHTIESRKYFVPINTVAQKRSIRVSLLLVILTLLLAIILIDLMLDSGIVLLVNKLPHTHFFSSH